MYLSIAQPFELELSLTMGQVFRWRPLGDGWFSGVLGEYLVHIRRTEGGVEYRTGGADGELDADLSELLCRYFRLDTDNIGAIYADLAGRDPQLEPLISAYWGMRVLRQEPWECLVSYICSAINTIERISAITESIAETFGQPVQLNGDRRHTFPPAERLVDDGAAEETLNAMKLGLRRAPNIMTAARRVCEGELDLIALRRQPYPEVMRTLMEGSRYRNKSNGIGPKIADCVALFALDQMNAFPIDTHVKRAVKDRYFHSAKLPSDARVVKWAQEKFGAYAGYAGQYLFYGRRQEAAESKLPFGDRWRGKFRAVPKEGPRWEALAEKYL